MINFYDGTPEADVEFFDANDDIVHGYGGSDYFDGGGGDDTLYGDGDDDSLFGGSGNDALDGGTGSDQLDGGAGDDTLSGGDGYDGLTYGQADAAVIVNLLTGTASGGAGNDTLSGCEAIYGSGFDDTLTGDANENFLYGYLGNNTLNGGAGNDELVAEGGNDILDGGDGNDGLDGGAGNDDLDGGNDNDVLRGGEDNDFLHGDDGDDTLDGGTGDDELDGGEENDVLNGGAGNDLLDGSEGDDVLHGEDGDDTLLGYFGNDILYGEEGDDLLRGEEGNDTLYGGMSIDQLHGGQGDDTYVLADADIISEEVGEGSDTVLVNFSYTLADNVENLTLVEAAAISGIGNALANIITGNSANNHLNGGAGFDQLRGGLGNDTYVLADNDAIVENVGQGTDTVWAAFSCTLGANLENLTLSGAAHLNGNGNALINILTGNSGNNILNGGAGIDQLRGGLGNDTYALADNDSITESAGQGTDTVWAAFSYTLAANLEYLTLTGTASINGAGNSLNNILTGNTGNNILNGGTGFDQLRGGLGNDTYALSDNDSISENAGQGTDTVWAAFSYTLGTNLEYLTLTGTASINGSGNTLNNILTGNSGNNILNGGTGLDQLRGGLGNDTYVLNDGDTITEYAGQGTDTVWAAFSYTLGANLENLTFTGTASLNGAGNTLNNVITGNSGNNILGGNSGFDTLNGGLGNDTLVGGANNDTLTGGTGLDAFRFDRFSTGFDTILDYRAVDDRIEFADAQLKKVAGAGPLNSTFFRASTTGNAVDRNDFLLYETDTGKLFYDMDGSGAGAKVLFAILGTSTHPAMTASEFVVV